MPLVAVWRTEANLDHVKLRGKGAAIYAVCIMIMDACSPVCSPDNFRFSFRKRMRLLFLKKRFTFQILHILHDILLLLPHGW